MGKFYHIEPRNASNNTVDYFQAPILFFMFEEPHAPLKKFDLHKHEFTEIFCITGGSGLMHYEKETVSLRPGDVCIVNKGVLHVEHSDQADDRLTYFTLTIDDSFPFDARKKETAVDKIHISSDLSANAKSILENIRQELINKPEYYEQSVRTLLTQFEIEIMRVATPSAVSESSEDAFTYDIPSIRDYIVKNYALDIKLSDLARMAYISEVHLINSFKKAYDISPIQFLINERIKNAKFLLRNTIDSITNIALAVGYNDPVYFSKIFHKLTGSTPSQYRKLMRCYPPTPEQWDYVD